MRQLARLLTFHSSQYLETLYQASVNAQTPFFRLNSSEIKIIEDPLDFYLHINVRLIIIRTASAKALSRLGSLVFISVLGLLSDTY